MKYKIFTAGLPFSRKEFVCKCGCSFDTVDHELLIVLENIRTWANCPVKINSGCRCEDHNKREEGSSRSRHLWGQAADIVVEEKKADEVADHLEESYPDKYGIGIYNGRTHIDIRRRKARWDKRSI